jgi:hypothetical protein
VFSDEVVTDARLAATAAGVDWLTFAGSHEFYGDPLEGWAGDLMGRGWASLEFTTSGGVVVQKGRRIAHLAVKAPGDAITLRDNAASFGCYALESMGGLVIDGNHQTVVGFAAKGCAEGMRWANGSTYGNQRIDTAVLQNCIASGIRVESHAMIDASTIDNVHVVQSPVGIWLDPWDRRGNRGAISNTTFTGLFFERIGNAYIYDAGDWSGDWKRQSTGREMNSATFVNMYGGPLDPAYRIPALQSGWTVHVAHVDDLTILGGKQGFSVPGDEGVFDLLHDGRGSWDWPRQAQAYSTVRAAGGSLFRIGGVLS